MVCGITGPSRHHPRRRAPMREYAKRDRLLREMGYPTYRSYLESDLWESIRKRVFRRDKKTCRLCTHKKGKAVHHKSYDAATMRGDTLKHLITLCHWCHKQIEFGTGGEKLTLKQVNKKTKKFKRRAKSQPWKGLAHKYKRRHGVGM